MLFRTFFCHSRSQKNHGKNNISILHSFEKSPYYTSAVVHLQKNIWATCVKTGEKTNAKLCKKCIKKTILAILHK